MAEHSDLVSEMAFLEKLNTEERLKLARKRRSQQLKKWSQREKDFNVMNRRKRNEGNESSHNNDGYKVHFVSSVMLLEAATRNDVDEVRRLLMLGVSPDSTNEDGLTALHQCCIDNCEEMMLLLIEFGANVNAKDSEHWTPLHAAATCGHLHLIRILIDKNADLLAVNADGNMPYDICEDEQTLDYIESEMAKRGITQELIDETRAMTENQMLDDMRELASKGYDLNYKDEQGATPLHIAAANGYVNVVEFLLDHHASTDECDNDLWQPIHAAACWGYIDVIEYLVQNGADLDAKTKNGETPFDICEDPDLKNRILQLKSEIESKRAVSSSRLRRSHSQNTRSHSIRRTSIREKSQIAKREALEEARIWQKKTIEVTDVKKEDSDIDSESQFYGDFNSKLTTHLPIELNNIDLKMDHTDGSYHNNSSNNNSSMNNDNYINNCNDNSVKSSQNSNSLALSTVKQVIQNVDTNYLSHYYQDNNYHDDNSFPEFTNSANQDSVKVEIHVTVNATPNSNSNQCFNNSTGTLIDLKKQRSEKHRNSLNNIFPERMKSPIDHHHPGPISSHKPSLPTKNNLNYSTNSNVNVPVIATVPSVNSKHSANPAFDSPPSPTSFKKKFRGNPSELIGEDDKKGCCTIC